MTPAEAISRRNRRRQTTLPTTTSTSLRSSFLKQVFLHEWWLIKANNNNSDDDKDDSRCSRLGIGGFTSKEKHVIRSFISAPIVKRHDAVTLKTVDGMTIMVHGHLNRSRTLENGFSHEVCDHFVIGFPYYWEEFASLSFDEEPARFSASGGNSGPSEGHGSNNISCRKIFDDILENYCDDFRFSVASNAKKETKKMNSEKKRANCYVEEVKHSGPLTRSRTRSLDN